MDKVSYYRRNFLIIQAQVIHANVLDVDITEATVIFLYLVPTGIAAMKDTLLSALDRGVRIVTYGESRVLVRRFTFLCSFLHSWSCSCSGISLSLFS